MGKYAIGFDLGGTTCKVGFFSENGKLIEKWEVPTDKKNDGKNILPNLAENIHSYLHGKKIPLRAENQPADPVQPPRDIRRVYLPGVGFPHRGRQPHGESRMQQGEISV